jgi:hypothetical protein
MLPRYGQRFGHLYVHNFRPAPVQGGGRASPKLSYAASFYERPPGSIAWATVSAFTALVVIVISAVGRLTSHIDLPSDIVVVLLALPVVAGAWIGLDREGDTIFVGSLGARISLIATMIISLTAAGMYLLGPKPDDNALHAPWLERPGADIWLFIVAVALFGFLSGFASFMLRALAYRHFVSRSDIAE